MPLALMPGFSLFLHFIDTLPFRRFALSTPTLFRHIVADYYARCTAAAYAISPLLRHLPPLIIFPYSLFSPFRFAFRRHYIRRFHY
jgi:hypothetical protein